MRYYKYLFTSIFLVSLSLSALADPFEGLIYFEKVEDEKSTYFRYYIKGDKIRIEDVNEEGNLNGILLIDMSEVSLKMLSCTAQMYIDVPLSPESESPKVKVEKTRETKMIAGKECIKYHVINKETFSNFDFWVNKDNYPFFTPMLRMLNREDAIAKAWVSSSIGHDFFPFEGVEYNSTGKEKTRLEVKEIKEMQLDDELFVIPANYSLFERKINN